MTRMKRWRGLVALARDAVVHGSAAIERVQRETAERPFGILEQIPPLATPARVVHVVHDASVTVVHGSIRLVSRAVGASIDLVLTSLEQRSESAPADDGPEPPIALDEE